MQMTFRLRSDAEKRLPGKGAASVFAFHQEKVNRKQNSLQEC
jgi:hypothetical protein